LLLSDLIANIPIIFCYCQKEHGAWSKEHRAESRERRAESGGQRSEIRASEWNNFSIRVTDQEKYHAFVNFLAV